MEKDTGDRATKILWAVCVVPLVIGIILMIASTETTEYSTNTYWVAQGYHHVYERYSGEIVDYIESNETCKIKGDTIIVKKKGKGYAWGMGLVIFFGMATAGCIWGALSDIDWRKNKPNA